MFVCDNSGWLTADIEANGSVLRAALEDEQAEPVIRCAVLLAMSALAKGGTWPSAALQTMSALMERMRTELLM